jgi:hypothetical protein
MNSIAPERIQPIQTASLICLALAERKWHDQESLFMLYLCNTPGVLRCFSAHQR